MLGGVTGVCGAPCAGLPSCRFIGDVSLSPSHSKVFIKQVFYITSLLDKSFIFYMKTY